MAAAVYFDEIAIEREIGKRIQDALGLKETTKIEIILELGAVAKVNVTYYPDKEDFERLIPILGEYKLVKRTKEL